MRQRTQPSEERDRAQTREPRTARVRVKGISWWATTLNVASFSGVLTILGVLFVLGPHGSTVSADENRNLSPVPEFTWESLFHGDYTRRVEAWVADRFPRRNNFIEVANWLKEWRGLSVDETFYAVTVQEGDRRRGLGRRLRGPGSRLEARVYIRTLSVDGGSR